MRHNVISHAVAVALVSAAAVNPVDAQWAVRESFAAAAQAGKPATFQMSRESSKTVANIESAVRYSFDKGWIIIGPTAEWHKLTTSGSEYDRASLGAAAEIFPAIQLGSFGKPYVTAQLALDRDNRGDSAAFAYSVAMTTFSRTRWMPGSQTTLWKNSLLRYYPLLGVERYAIGGSATIGAAQLNVELWPVKGRLQALLTQSASIWRSSAAGLPSNLNRTSVVANVYVDSAQHVAIGAEYMDAFQPERRFDRVRRSSVGLKVKF